MNAAPSAASFGLLLGLSFFLGLAFEDFFTQAAMDAEAGFKRSRCWLSSEACSTCLIPSTSSRSPVVYWCSGSGFPSFTPSIFAHAMRQESRMSGLARGFTVALTSHHV